MCTSRVLYSSSFYLEIKSLGLHASTCSCKYHEYLFEIYKVQVFDPSWKALLMKLKESALMPFNPSRVFVLVRLQVKVSDEGDQKMVHHKKGFLNLISSFYLLMCKKINISLQCMKIETKRNSEGWHFIMLYALVKYRDYQGRTNEGKACRTDSSCL